VLLEPPRVGGSRTTAAVRLESGPARGAKLLAVTDEGWRGPREPGAIVRVRGVAKPPLRSDDGRFDWPAYLRRRGIAHELHLSALTETGEHRGGVTGAIDTARRRAERTI